MENKIVYLKTYIITVALLLIILIASIVGLIFYYEDKIDKIENQKNTINNNATGITIVQDVDTNVDNVIAK